MSQPTLLEAGLRHLSGPPTDEISPNGLVALAVMRDEGERLPFWLAYHRWLGIDHFCIVDHRSADDTPSLLARQIDVTVYRSDAPFGGEQGKFHWLANLIHACQHQRWLAILDGDELLVALPWCRAGLSRTVAKAEDEGASAIVATLVDCYPDKLDGGHRLSTPVWWHRSPWFDHGPYIDWSRPTGFPATIYGGIRERLFWPRWRDAPKWQRRLLWRGEPPCMSKVPLLRAGAQGRFVNNHRVDDVTVAKGTLAILHYKFEADLARRTDIALTERQYYRRSQEYRYFKPLLKQHRRSLISSRSHRLKTIHSLAEAGLCHWDYDRSQDVETSVAADQVLSQMP